MHMHTETLSQQLSDPLFSLQCVPVTINLPLSQLINTFLLEAFYSGGCMYGMMYVCSHLGMCASVFILLFKIPNSFHKAVASLPGIHTK